VEEGNDYYDEYNQLEKQPSDLTFKHDVTHLPSRLETPQEQREDLEIFRTVFELFDHNRNGHISKQDMLGITQGYQGPY